MIIEIKVPTVGESISEVTIAKWLKKDGDIVKQDEVLCEMESEKATFELNAEKPGVSEDTGSRRRHPEDRGCGLYYRHRRRRQRSPA